MRMRKHATRLARCVACGLALGCGPQVGGGTAGDDASDGTGRTQTSTRDDASGTSDATTASDTSTTAGPSTGAQDGSDTGESRPVCEYELPPHYFECDPWLQDCPEGEKCVAWNNDGGGAYPLATRCIEVARAPKGLGEPCTGGDFLSLGKDDCEVGARCWSWAAGAAGWPEEEQRVCVPLCAGCPDAPECPEDHLCISWKGASDSNEPALNLCAHPCDPLADDACSTNATCVYWPDRECAFSCGPLSPSPLSQGEPCEAVNMCEQGSACIYAGTFGPACGATKCCSAFCDPNDPGADATCDALTPGQSCVPLCAGEGGAPGVCGVADP
jgi:hypothetical protein